MAVSRSRVAPARHGATSRLRCLDPTMASTIRRSLSSAAGISSTILPRDITTTRSQRPASSSGSLDLTTTATPSLAFPRSAS